MFQVVKVRPSTSLTFAILWAIITYLVARFLGFGLVAAILTGLALTSLHWVVLFVHHFGHSVAAKGTGFPMTGVLLWWGLATSLYPRDEPELPASLHIRRALGGPIASLAFGLLAAALAWLLRGETVVAWLLPAFAGFDSLFIFGIGSLVPLGFNDGSTLIRWSTSRSRNRAA